MEEYICGLCGLVSSDPDEFETDLCCGNFDDTEEPYDLTCEECYDKLNEDGE